MGRMRQLDADARRKERELLLADIDLGNVTVSEAVKRMRRITGLTQADFAQRIAGISKAALAAIEQGQANPTVATLNRIGRTFGLRVGYTRAKRPAS